MHIRRQGVRNDSSGLLSQKLKGCLWRRGIAVNSGMNDVKCQTSSGTGSVVGSALGMLQRRTPRSIQQLIRDEVATGDLRRIRRWRCFNLTYTWLEEEEVGEYYGSIGFD